MSWIGAFLVGFGLATMLVSRPPRREQRIDMAYYRWSEAEHAAGRCPQGDPKCPWVTVYDLRDGVWVRRDRGPSVPDR